MQGSAPRSAIRCWAWVQCAAVHSLPIVMAWKSKTCCKVMNFNEQVIKEGLYYWQSNANYQWCNAPEAPWPVRNRTGHENRPGQQDGIPDSHHLCECALALETISVRGVLSWFCVFQEGQTHTKPNQIEFPANNCEELKLNLNKASSVRHALRAPQLN